MPPLSPMHKFSKAERGPIIERVAFLNRCGWSQARIAADVGVSQPMVSKYLTQIMKEYKERALAERDAMIREKLEQLRDVREMALDAYVASLSDAEAEQIESVPTLGKKGQPLKDKKSSTGYAMTVLKHVYKKEGRLPANEFLGTVLRTLEAECKLLGLNEPDRADVAHSGGVAVGVFDWDRLLAPAAGGLVEERQARMLEDVNDGRGSLASDEPRGGQAAADDGGGGQGDRGDALGGGEHGAEGSTPPGEAGPDGSGGFEPIHP